MRWFEGTIVQAVEASRKNGSVFVVFIEGKDAESTKFASYVNSEEVSQHLGGDNFVAIKLEGGSVEYQQFKEIYKNAKVPSLFFIGKGGAPLEIVETANEVNDILSKVENALNKNGIQLLTSILENNSRMESNRNAAANDQGETERNQPGKESAEASTSTPKTSITKTDDEKLESKDEKKTDEEKVEISKEEKLERAKELLEKTKEAKKRVEEEKEKSKEMERRRMGQDVQKMKRWQEEQELKEMVETREREKREEQAARKRVLEQIQQDKADRMARFASNAPPPQAASTSAQPTSATKPASNHTRIQFKLPDGSAHTNEFPLTATLKDVKFYIRTNITLPFKTFVLATTFPKREFGDEDDKKTLDELGLFPSAVLLILPVSNGAVTTSSDGSFNSLIWNMITPFLNLFNYLKGLVFGNNQNSNPAAGSNGQKRPSEAGNDNSRPIPKRRAAESRVIKKQGNVHRLTDRNDSDDENNTWNGNSTQQM